MLWLFLVYLVLFLLGILACSMFGYAILQPFAKAVRGKRRPTRFTTVDFLWLTILLQIPLVCLSNIGRLFNNRFETIVLAITTVIVVLLFVGVWWRGVATLSGLGICGVWRRGVFLTILLPVAILGSALGMPMLIMLLAFSLRELYSLYVWMSVAVLTPVVAYSFRLASLWVLAEIEQRPDYGEKSTSPGE